MGPARNGADAGALGASPAGGTASAEACWCWQPAASLLGVPTGSQGGRRVEKCHLTHSPPFWFQLSCTQQLLIQFFVPSLWRFLCNLSHAVFEVRKCPRCKSHSKNVKVKALMFAAMARKPSMKTHCALHGCHCADGRYG